MTLAAGGLQFTAKSLHWIRPAALIADATSHPGHSECVTPGLRAFLDPLQHSFARAHDSLQRRVGRAQRGPPEAPVGLAALDPPYDKLFQRSLNDWAAGAGKSRTSVHAFPAPGKLDSQPSFAFRLRKT